MQSLISRVVAKQKDLGEFSSSASWARFGPVPIATIGRKDLDAVRRPLWELGPGAYVEKALWMCVWSVLAKRLKTEVFTPNVI